MPSIKELLEKNQDLYEEIMKYKKEPKRSVFDKIRGKKSTKKEFILPKKLTAGAKRKIKKNYALVIYLRNNGYIEFMYAPIQNDLIYVGQSGQYHAATADYMFKTIHKNKFFPVLIQPEWALTPVKVGDEVTNEQVPFSGKVHAEKTAEKGLMAPEQKVYLQILKKAELKGAKGPGLGKNLIWIIVGVIVVLYLLSTILTGGSQ